MNRAELDAFVAHHGLSRVDVEAALEVAAARPSAAELRSALIRLLQLAGLLSLAAGVIFCIAANWEVFAVFGRFALLEILLAACVGLALWQPPPRPLGRFGLLGAFILTGALLALFGQTYQTGADLYELFLTWALLGLLFAVAAHWSVAWAAWAVVLNAALALYCGWRPDGGLLSLLLPWSSLNETFALLIAMAINLALWFGTELSAYTRFDARIAAVTPRWLRRLIVGCALAFGAWAGFIAMEDRDFGRGGASAADLLALLLLAVFLATIAFHSLRRRNDVFALAGIAGTLIFLGATFLAQVIRVKDEGILLILALWLIGSSTLLGHVLMRYVREWRAAGSLA
jgi:uncharacterized membrane protein